VITGQADAGSTVTVNGVQPLWRQRHLHGDHSGSDSGRPAGVDGVLDRRGGQHATTSRTLTVDRGTTVTLTGIEGGDTRSTRRGGSWHRDHGPG
jgi:hypothetical protein